MGSFKTNLYKVTKINNKYIYLTFIGIYLALLIDFQLKEKVIFTNDIVSTVDNLVLFSVPILIILYFANFFRNYKEQSIKLTDNSLILPKKFGKAKLVNINYHEIIACDIRGSDHNCFISIQTKNANFQIYKEYFNKKKKFKEFYKDLLGKLKSQNVLQNSKVQKKLEKNIFKKRKYGCIFFTSFLTVIFLIQHLTHNTEVHNLISVGAANTSLVISGDYFRLLSASILHANYLHFVFNILIIFPFLYLLEGILGASKTFLIFILGQFIGLSFSLSFNQDIILGASAGIFSLIGAYFVICLKHKLQLPAGLYLTTRNWFLFLLVNIVFFFLIKNISFSAHLVGFLTGILICLFFLSGTSLEKAIRNKKAIVCYTYALLFLPVSLLSYNYIDYLSNPEYRSYANKKVLMEMINKKNPSIKELNAFAWNISIDDFSTYELNSIAKIALKKALDNKNLETFVKNQLLDSLASVEYRLGNIKEAILIENNLYLNSKTDEDSEFYSSEIARFLSEEDSLILSDKHSSNQCIIYEVIPFVSINVGIRKGDCEDVVVSNSKKLIIKNINTDNIKHNKRFHKFDRRVAFYPTI